MIAWFPVTMSKFRKPHDKAKKIMAGLVNSLKMLETEESRLRSLKRNVDYHTEEYPSSKKLITEEVMVGYLEQLNLATIENSQQSTESMDKHLLPTQTLSVTSCQDTVKLGTRKRHFKCDLPEEEMDIDIDTDVLSQSGTKRLKVDVAAYFPASNCGSVCNVRTVHYHHAENPTMVPSLCIEGKSDLSSIPETCETTHRLPEEASCDHKLKIELDDDLLISVGTQCESHIHFPLPSPPPSDKDQSCVPTNIKPHLWVAPELQSFCTSQEPLLPPCIVKEIRSQGMELVPYVGSVLEIFLASKNEDSMTLSKDLSKDEDNKDGPLFLGMHNSTYLSDR